MPLDMSVPSVSYCTAGYFTLHYQTGSFFDGNSSALSTMCELFTNLSGFIISSLSGTNTVHIYLGDYNGTLNPAPLAVAASFYLAPTPNSPANPYPGILESQTYKTIKTGVDAYKNLPPSVFYGHGPATQYFHGYIAINNSIQWHTGLNTSASSGDFDLYTVMLHEAMHVLGIATLISSTGESKWGADFNYYTSYDRFLFDASGSPLLTSSTQATCPNSNLAYTLSASAIASGTCPGTTSNSTTCSAAVQYSSASTGTIPVYTPECFEPASSLCHFEDLCYAPSFTASSGCYSGANNSNNDLYWVMSNAVQSGTCYIKRFPKPVERLVLCDLGYDVNATYTSNASAASFTYGGSSCGGKNIWGIDDGFNGTVYTNTTTLSSIGIPTNVIASNDAPSTVKLSCVEVIYSNASASINSGSLVVTANTGYHGLTIIKYLPENSSGQQGNPTYVYVYFVPTGCSPSGLCSLVQNGNFENIVYGPGCSGVISGPTNLSKSGTNSLPGCWEAYLGTPKIVKRNCTAPYDLGNNVFGTTLDSYNGSPNDHVIGLEIGYTGQVHLQTGLLIPPFADVLKNNLSSAMVPGTTYQLSFLASNFSNSPNLKPIIVTVASAPVLNAPSTSNFPTGLDILTQFTLSPTNSAASPWTAYTQTFVFNPSITAPHSVLIIGGNVGLTFPAPATGNYSFWFLDEVSLQPVPNPTFIIPNAQVCGNESYLDLNQYAAGSGTFTGANITYTVPQYDFNAGKTLPSGNYPIGYSLSNGTCVNTVWQNVLVDVPYVLAGTSSTTDCSNFSTSFTLNTTSVYTAGPLDPGIYFFILDTGIENVTRKIIVAR